MIWWKENIFLNFYSSFEVFCTNIDGVDYEINVQGLAKGLPNTNRVYTRDRTGSGSRREKSGSHYPGYIVNPGPVPGFCQNSGL